MLKRAAFGDRPHRIVISQTGRLFKTCCRPNCRIIHINRNNWTCVRLVNRNARASAAQRALGDADRKGPCTKRVSGECGLCLWCDGLPRFGFIEGGDCGASFRQLWCYPQPGFCPPKRAEQSRGFYSIGRAFPSPSVSTNKGRLPTIFHITPELRVFEIQFSTSISMSYSKYKFGCKFARCENCSVGTERGDS